MLRRLESNAPSLSGGAPQTTDFDPYETALPFLVSRLGSYCSYCERRVASNLAVEHLLPKDSNPHLKYKWTNFLLACVNCNSTKGDKVVDFTKLLFPDRDNTFRAIEYLKDGQVVPSNVAVAGGLKVQVEETLALMGLNKKVRATLDENGAIVALDRASQRQEVWGVALAAKGLYMRTPIPAMVEMIILNACASGFFSIWMAAFDDCLEVRIKLIQAFKGTQASGCFDNTGSPVCAPNPDGLVGGGKL